MKFETFQTIMLAALVVGAILYVIALLIERRIKDKENKNMFNPPEFFDE